MQLFKNLPNLATLLFAVAVTPFALRDTDATVDDLSQTRLQLADARGSRHCHSTPRRVYCHTREVLPLSLSSSATVKT